MTNEASSMGCLYYLISHHVLCTTYTLGGEIMQVREKSERWIMGNGEKWRETKRREEVEEEKRFWHKWLVSFTGLRWRFTCAEQSFFLFVRRKSRYSSRTRRRLCFNLFPRLNAIKWSFKNTSLTLKQNRSYGFQTCCCTLFFLPRPFSALCHVR